VPTSLTFTEELIKAVVGGAAPTLILIIGGRLFLDWYDLRETRDGDIRSAFFLGYDEENCEYLGMVLRLPLP